nr:hypothetical protein [Tanacetum cinerariifolium]
VWNEEREKSFKELKQRLVSAPHGKVIAYASRQLKPYEDYDTNIQYHLGKANVVADALSRKSGMIDGIKVKEELSAIWSGWISNFMFVDSKKEDNAIWTIVENLDEQTEFRLDEDDVLWQ